MGWRIVQQPNGRLARFSENVDDFTDWHMTVDEAIAMCRMRELSEQDAKAKVQHGIDAGIVRYNDCIRTIRVLHGSRTAKRRDRKLRKPVIEE